VLWQRRDDSVGAVVYARTDQGRARTAGVERSGGRLCPWDADSRLVIWPARRISDLGRLRVARPHR
jgi:hypothetical protein